MYSLFLALRYLRAQRIMGFAVGGVAIGIAVLIVVTSLMGGFMRDLKERIRGMQSHFTVVPDRDTGWGGEGAGLLDGIRAVPHVTFAAPRLEYGAWMGIRGGRRPVRLVGIDPRLEAKGELAPFFRAGGVDLAALKGDWAVPGCELPAEAGASCAFMTAREIDGGDESMMLAVPREGLDFVSAGRFRSGLWESDSTTVFLPIDRMAAYLRIPAGSYSLIAVSVDDFARSGAAVDDALVDVLHDRKLHGAVRPWTETQANFLQAVESEKAVQVIIMIAIIIVAGFTILSLYIMMVQAKIRDLGVLRALGATGPGVAGIFVESGMACGAAGAILGILLGVVVATSLDDFTVHVRTFSAGLAARGGARVELALLAAGAVALVAGWRRLYSSPSWAWKAAAAAAIVAAAQFHLRAAGGTPWLSALWLAASLSLLAAKRPSLSTLGHAGAALWLLLAGGIALAVSVADPKPGFEGFDLFPRQVYKLDRVPVLIDGAWIGMIVGVALVIGAIAALWPAFRAGLADPLEVIRDG